MTSPADHLRARLARQQTRQTIDVPVAGLADIGLHVRYARLVGFDDFTARLESRRKAAKGTSWQMEANLDFLVDSCVGVWAEVDGQRYGFHEAASTDPDEWPRFDADVRAMLPDGVGDRVIDIARAVFAAGYAPEERAAADADILRHTDQVMAFCGYKDLAGN